jgi:mRNA interferase MazF
MKKNFDEWNEIKKKISLSDDVSSMFYKEREVWWCTLGINIGFEQDGKGTGFRRPVLIMKKINRHTVIVLPLTTKIKENVWSYVKIDCPDNLPRSIIISQVRLIDVRRLAGKMFTINIEAFVHIKKEVRNLFS